MIQIMKGRGEPRGAPPGPAGSAGRAGSAGPAAEFPRAAVPNGIATVLDAVLATDPDRTAIVDRRRRMSYAELDAEADAAAAALAAMGVRTGDRVAACLPNGADIVVAFHGAMRLGAIWAGVNQALALPEKQAILDAARPAVVLADPATADQLRQRWHVGRLVDVDPAGRESAWAALVAAGRGARRPPAPDPRAPAAIAYTSGTTGLPRGVVHSQANLVLPGAAMVASRRYGPDLRKGDFLPLTILNLLVLTTLLASQAGGCCVLFDRRDADGIVEWIHAEQVNVWNAVPAVLYSMVGDADRYAGRLGSLREVWTGGADCPEHLRQAFERRFGVPVCATYGLTEAPSMVTIDPIDGPHVAGASGVSLPHLDVCARDDAGTRLVPFEEGEITVAAVADGSWANRYTTMLGYWAESGEQAGPSGAVDPPGVLRTGDLGWLDDDGYLFVRDRKKLLIVRGGANVYPAEVERVLAAAPGVRGCAVLGIPDDRLGERVVGVVELEVGAEPDEDALRRWCLDNLAKYKVPDRIAAVEALPRNAMGKVQRADLVSLLGPLAPAPPGPPRSAKGG